MERERERERERDGQTARQTDRKTDPKCLVFREGSWQNRRLLRQ